MRGLLSFFGALFLTGTQPSLRQWYRRTLLRTFVVAIFAVVVMLGSGLVVVQASVENPWHASFAMIAVVFAVLFLSGRFVAVASSFVAGAWVDERGLVSCFLQEKAVNLPSAPWSDRSRELLASFRNALLSLALAPVFFFPWLLPLAVLILAWGFGRESLAFGRRLAKQSGLSPAPPAESSFSTSFAVGLGFLPALASLVPVLGWTVWPLLQVAGVIVFSGSRTNVAGFRGVDPNP